MNGLLRSPVLPSRLGPPARTKGALFSDCKLLLYAVVVQCALNLAAEGEKRPPFLFRGIEPQPKKKSERGPQPEGENKSDRPQGERTKRLDFHQRAKEKTQFY